MDGIRHHPHRGEQDPPRSNERPPPRFQARRRRTSTRARDDYDDDEPDEYAGREHYEIIGGTSGLRIHHQYNLEEHTLQYITHLPGDTEEDARRMRQYLVLEDDIQSIDDEEYYSREPDDRDDLVQMEERQRLQDAYDRQRRRDDGIQGSFRGTKKELEEMRNSLLAIT
eukprot:1680869-Amphidinium_carterae.1